MSPLLTEYGASATWDVLTQMRKAIYDDMVADTRVIRENQWPHTVGLLRVAQESDCLTGLATMSAHEEALHVLRALDIEESLFPAVPPTTRWGRS